MKKLLIKFSGSVITLVIQYSVCSRIEKAENKPCH